MARYIRIASKDDTDVLIDIEKIQYVQKKEDGCVIGFFNCRLTSGADFDDVVNAIDVAEVRRGKWTLHTDGSGTCSECGTIQKNVWDYNSWQNYCGHCGARMDGDEDETV